MKATAEFPRLRREEHQLSDVVHPMCVLQLLQHQIRDRLTQGLLLHIHSLQQPSPILSLHPLYARRRHALVSLAPLPTRLVSRSIATGCSHRSLRDPVPYPVKKVLSPPRRPGRNISAPLPRRTRLLKYRVSKETERTYHAVASLRLSLPLVPAPKLLNLAIPALRGIQRVGMQPVKMNQAANCRKSHGKVRWGQRAQKTCW